MTDYTNPSAELRARVALEKHRFRNTHSLGQNFLLAESLIALLLDDAGIAPEDNVLEIGPGAGVMTRLLAQRAKHVLAVEVDRGLEPVLEDVLEGMENAQVVFQDIMKSDLRALIDEHFGGESYRVVANLPYYITADILLKLAASDCPPQSIAIMVQKEAAERVMSVPGTKQWCALAAELQFYGAAQVLTEVAPEAFDPPPHVMSCFIRIDKYAEAPVNPLDEKVFRKLIRAAFAMRRKTLANNLKATFGFSQEVAKAILSAAGADEKVRGEALTLEELCRVSDAITKMA
ncbi:MAG: ribosomal RNA small subunit methyltransferase A [Clostridia bacterium]|nr:ribosomal RNA small subunit methyltransferase A [Clostridia bacterium]